VVKHAEATEIRIGLVLEDDRFLLSISDNGKGFQVNGSPEDPSADGLRNLRQRLEQIGGTCNYTSKSGAGTSVEMAVPLS
jgi:signal transduction histidine kinase